MEILASQFRAARALLDLNQEVVGSWVQLDPREISRWERAKYKLLSSVGTDLKSAFEREGVEFTSARDDRGAGVRWRQPGRYDLLRGAQFRAARAFANISMRKLQELSGVDRNFVMRLETGQIGAVNLSKIKSLEKAFANLGIMLTTESENFGAGVWWEAAD